MEDPEPPEPLAATAEKKPRRKRNKKPKDMPRRPLSAYNLFFQEERERILSAQREGKEQDDFIFPTEEDHQKQAAQGKKKAPVLFQALARCIGKRWKALPKDKVAEYEGRAKTEMKAYREKMDEYQQAVVLKSIDESEKLKKSREKQALADEAAEGERGADDGGPGMIGSAAGQPMNPHFHPGANLGQFPGAPGGMAFGPGASLGALQMMQQYPHAAANGFFQTGFPGPMDPSGSFNPAAAQYAASGMDPSFFAPGGPGANMLGGGGMYQFSPQMQQGFAPGMHNFPQSFFQGQPQYGMGMQGGAPGDGSQFGGLPFQQPMPGQQPPMMAPGQSPYGLMGGLGGMPGMPPTAANPAMDPTPQQQAEPPQEQAEQQEGEGSPYNATGDSAWQQNSAPAGDEGPSPTADL
mmetsp:Transcript_31880/g.66528  ORF Transcript_31880/g.66528 Transcript_31880/m.66528 type:complete len:408 (-) Transcript_31880:79-1302(-)